MALVEINFDGIVGPSHNYAGLSLGNLAATRNAGQRRHPRAAALQGIAKMRAQSRARPGAGHLPAARRARPGLAGRARHRRSRRRPRRLRAAALSASAMWAANAATVSPAPDTADGRCHLTVANLRTMPHRSHEWPATLAQLRLAFADRAHFAVHAPVPATVRRRGRGQSYAALRRATTRRASRSSSMASAAAPSRPASISKRRAPSRGCTGSIRRAPCSSQQSEEAIAAGAFHNDVVAVANEHVLFAHEQAFADKARLLRGRCSALLPEVEIVEVPASVVSLADAVRSYLFNAQLVTPARRAAWR